MIASVKNHVLVAARNRPVIIDRAFNHGLSSFLLDYFPMPSFL